MRIRPHHAPFDDGFSPETDLFKHHDFGTRLTRLVEGIEHSSTLILDGPWGSGKSTFLRQWLGELKKEGKPYVLFDAFANDFFEDAFIPLSAEIFQLADQQIPKTNSKLKAAKKSAQKVLKTIAPYTAKAGLRAATFGLVDYGDIEGGAKSVIEALSGGVENAVEEAARELIEDAINSQSVLQKFQNDMTALVRAYQEKVKQDDEALKPVVFVIDELDRCKPTFALNLLERIKHLFDIDGVVFLLVTNLEQMEAAVCGAYGEKTNAPKYLEKFYDLRFRLPVPDNPQSNASKYLHYLRDNLDVTTGDIGVDKDIVEILSQYFSIYSTPYRTMERIYTLVQINAASLKNNHFKIAPMIAGLCIMKHLRDDLYQKARVEALGWQELSECLRFDLWEDERLREWCKQQWQDLLEVGDARPNFLRQGASKKTLSWGANLIDSFDFR